MSLRAVRWLPALVLASIPLGACNAVLGIDEAQLQSSAGGSSSGAPSSGSFDPGSPVTPQVVAGCVAPTGECRGCFESDCAAPRQQCLANPECRAALKAYRVCIGSQCQDRDGSCKERLQRFESQSFPAAERFSDCVFGACPSECMNQPLVSPCELYCSCMGTTCRAELQANRPTTPWLGADCVAKCEEAQSAGDVTCRLTHCEAHLAAPSFGHCYHALGEGTCVSGATAKNTCTDPTKQQSSFKCDKGSECCSNICSPMNHSCE